MAKIRFEDVTIKAGAIELDGIEDPSAFMRGLGLQDANVKEGGYEDAAPPVASVPEDTHTDQQLEAAKKEEITESPRPRTEITPELFDGARRLRDVVEVFMKAEITDADDIVDICMRLKSQVSILSRVSDIPGRMPLAVNTWLEQNSQ